MNTEESREEIVAYFNKQSNCELPFCIRVAAGREGKHVVIVGGTHGNEPAGVRAMVAFHRRLNNGEIKLDRGKVSLLLGNPHAYQKDQRYIDRDLNRSFDDPDGTKLEGRRAGEIIKYFDQNNDITVLLDLHSVSIGDFKICVYEKENPQSLDVTLSISNLPLHFAYHPAHMPGALITEAGQRRICGLILECGNHLSRQGVNTAHEHIQALLCHFNLMEGSFSHERSMPETITQYESIQFIKPGANFKFLIDGVKTGTKLANGEKFARDDHGYHIAPRECFIVVPSMKVKSTDHDAGFLCKMNRFAKNDL
jgi:succinylglutamate desuccinylase